jgi:cysteine-rich repeat protein
MRSAQIISPCEAAIAAALAVVSVACQREGPDCSQELNQRGYEAGHAAGTSIVNEAWDRVGQDPDCYQQVASLVRASAASLVGDLPDDASLYVQCRTSGLEQGVEDQLDTIEASLDTLPNPSPGVCEAVIVPPANECGNGVVEPGEQCDDGNTTPGDGCDDQCNVE